jgi:hypothetical protein
LVRIVTTTPKPLLPQDKKQPAGDLAELRKMMQEQFMAHAGNTLDIILKAYPLPLFIIGNEELLSQFKALSNGGHTVVKYIFADFADATVKEIQKNISATIGDWSMVHHQYLACRLEKAAREKRLVTGIKDVWKNAIHHKGSLLLVDKNYHCSDPQPTGEDILSNLMEPYHPFSYIKSI